MLNIFEEHKERIVTGLALLGAAIVIGLIDNFFIMWIVFGAIYIIAFKEALALFQMQGSDLLKYAIAIWVLAGVFPHGDGLFVLLGVVFAGAVAYSSKLEWKQFLPFIYPTAGMLFIFTLYQEYGVGSLFWLLVVVAMTDVGAYVFGKSLGKTQFSPTSPNKTLEGVFGGIGVATVSGMFAGLVVADLLSALVVSLFVSISSIFGDLYESSLKRAAEVKDSGELFPGHGGMLDRIDGYLFGGIVMLVFLRGII